MPRPALVLFTEWRVGRRRNQSTDLAFSAVFAGARAAGTRADQAIIRAARYIVRCFFIGLTAICAPWPPRQRIDRLPKSESCAALAASSVGLSERRTAVSVHSIITVDATGFSTIPRLAAKRCRTRVSTWCPSPLGVPITPQRPLAAGRAARRAPCRAGRATSRMFSVELTDISFET